MDPTLKANTISRLKEVLPKLTPRLVLVAKYIVDHPADFGLDPIRETARKAGVSTFTLVRMSKRLGFDCFEDMREPFRHALVSTTHLAETPDWISTLRDGSATGAAQADAAANGLGIVRRSLELQTSAQMERVVALMLGARTTYLTAVRASYGLAYYFHYVGRMALPSLQLIPRSMNSALDDLHAADERDVLVAITFTPYSRETIEACKFARQQGVRLIILSDSEVISSEFAADENLIVSVVSTHHFACFSGAMSVIESLLALLVQMGGQNARDRVKDHERMRIQQNAYWGARKKH